MKPDNIFIRLLKKLKCKLGFHHYCTWPDGHIECWRCGKIKEEGME